MVMTALRTVAGNLDLLDKTPPQAMVERHAPRRIQQLDEDKRAAVTELAHWTYGAASGGLFEMLPANVRRSALVGPAYGLGIWLVFELAIAPSLGVRHTPQRQVAGRSVVAFDHAMYGVVVAGHLGPAR